MGSGVPVPTARASTEKASSGKQIPERVVEEAGMSMKNETSSNSTLKGTSLEIRGNVNSAAPGCSNSNGR